MHLGKLGEQVVLKSPKSFEQLNYTGGENALADIYFSRKKSRDNIARKKYRNIAAKFGTECGINI